MVKTGSHHFYPQALIEYWSVQRAMLEAEAQRNMLFVFKKFSDKIMACTTILRALSQERRAWASMIMQVVIGKLSLC